MVTPNRFRSCHPRAGITRTPLATRDTDQRLTAITDLEHSIRALEIPALGHSTVAEHAAVHILDPSTLAVVVLCSHNADILEQVIRAQNYTLTGIAISRDIITLTL